MPFGRSGSLDELLVFLSPSESACVVVGSEPTTIWLRVVAVPGSEELAQYTITGLHVTVNAEARSRIKTPVQEAVVVGARPAVWSDIPGPDSPLLLEAETLPVQPSASPGTYTNVALLVEGSGAPRSAVSDDADLVVEAIRYRQPGSTVEHELKLNRSFWLMADDDALDACEL